MAPIRACFVVNAVGETSVPADIATGLARHTDVEVDILAWWDAAGFHDEDRVTVVELDAPETTVGIDRDSYATCRELFPEYDIVQAHHCHSGSFAKAIASRCGVPSVSREGNMRRGFTRLGRIANGLTNPMSARVVCNSPAVYRSFRRWERLLLDESVVEIIPNGVDLARIDEAATRPSPVPSESLGDGILVGTAGMLTPQKDHETLIRGVGIASRRLEIDIDLVIAGEGDRRAALVALAERLGLRDRVHFLGLLERDAVYAMMHDVDIYAMPSRWEGFSAAAVEALATATPCIFADIDAFRLPYADVARLHPVADPDGLADEIVSLATDPTRREELGQAGRELVAGRYVIDEVSKAYASLYRNILS